MTDLRLPEPTHPYTERRRALAPAAAFHTFSLAVFVFGALEARTRQLSAGAVAPVAWCPQCIEGHAKAAGRAGATAEQLPEAIRVTAEMRVGAAYAHSIKAFEAEADSERG